MKDVLIDLTGRKFNKLFVLGRAPSRTSPSGNLITRWHCVCDCGNELDVDAYALKSGNTKSCGCNKHKSQAKDISGQRFGMLQVVKLDHINNQITYWLCKCDCGNNTVVAKSNLLNGNTKSCGCLASEGEKIIAEKLNKYNVCYGKQQTFYGLLSDKGNPLKFDFVIFKDYKVVCVIEFQGKQHYENTKFGQYQREYTDIIKRNWCADQHIPLYEIRYDDNISMYILAILYFHKLIPCQVEESTEALDKRCNDYPAME